MYINCINITLIHRVSSCIITSRIRCLTSRMYSIDLKVNPRDPNSEPELR